MASTIKVNNIQNQCGANIINESANTITIGASGDTISLAAGASQSGFGRTGTVNWDTTAKTTGFTAVSGNGYFVNTTSGAITMTLPASPSAGDIVAFKDYANTFATNNITIGRNGSNLDGNAENKTLSTNSLSMSLVYVDATQGWKSVEEGTGFIGEGFLVATGGTESTCGDYKIHTFTGPGCFSVSALATAPADNVVDYLVVAGGGGGAGDVGGAGGAGGFRLSNSTCMPAPTTSPLANPVGITVTATDYPITVGAGGVGSPNVEGCNGSNSVFSTITSAGGGGGGHRGSTGTVAGSGGSGGGGAGESVSTPATANGGSGNTPPVTPPQGNTGGAGATAPVSPRGGGGGGGAGAVGGAASNSPVANAGGDGGDGSYVSPVMAGCNGTPGPVGSVRYFAGGGGGGTEGGPSVGGNGTLGRGGAGGGGQSPSPTSGTGPGYPGTINTGGGGSGASRQACAAPSFPVRVGGNGGSGIVIIRYKFQ